MFESTNKVVRGWFVRSNKHRIHRDVAECMGISGTLRRLARGAQWCNDTPESTEDLTSSVPELHSLSTSEQTALRWVLDAKPEGYTPGTLLRRLHTSISMTDAARSIAALSKSICRAELGLQPATEEEVLRVVREREQLSDCKLRLGQDVAVTSRRASGGWVQHESGAVGRVVASLRPSSLPTEAVTFVVVHAASNLGKCTHLKYPRICLTRDLRLWPAQGLKGLCVFHDCWRSRVQAGCEACQTSTGTHRGKPWFIVNESMGL